MKDKNYIELILRMYKNNEHSLEDSVNDILWKYSDSKRYNHNNFVLGFFIGGFLMLLILEFTT